VYLIKYTNVRGARQVYTTVIVPVAGCTTVTVPEQSYTNVSVPYESYTTVSVSEQSYTSISVPVAGCTTVSVPEQRYTNVSVPYQTHDGQCTRTKSTRLSCILLKYTISVYPNKAYTTGQCTLSKDTGLVQCTLETKVKRLISVPVSRA